MLPAIHLNDQLFLGTEKIHDIGTDGLLASKLQSAQPMRAQARPQQIFAVGLLAAKLASEFALFHI